MAWTTVSEILAKDPLTPSTEARGRRLVVAAGAAILISVFGVEVRSTAWLELEVPDGAPEILAGALSVVLSYLLVAFCFFAWADISRWRAAALLMDIEQHHAALEQVRTSYTEIERAWRKAGIGPQSIKAAKEITEAKALYLGTMRAKLSDLERRCPRLAFQQIARLVVFDAGLPLALGVFAWIKLSGDFFPFVRAMLQ